MSVKRVASLIALASAVITVLLIVVGKGAAAGPTMILFFVALGITFNVIEKFKPYTYTMMIFAAVSAAMYYPGAFDTWGDVKLASLITPLIQIIMFGMGTSMSVRDFTGVVKMPKGVFIGLVAQFTIMPCLGFFFASISGFEPEIAAGMILIGSVPSGMASNVITYLAKGNLALSITLTAILTLMAPFMTPVLMKTLAGTFVQIDALAMMFDIFKMVIIPIGLGLLFNKFLSGKAKWLDDAMPVVSMAGIGFIITIITAAGQQSLLSIGLLLIFFVLMHNLSGYVLGYVAGKLFRMDERDCRTLAIEIGMQNGGLASGLAKEMGKIATVGLAAAVFGPLMNITGSVLASYWAKKPIKEKDK